MDGFKLPCKVREMSPLLHIEVIFGLEHFLEELAQILSDSNSVNSIRWDLVNPEIFKNWMEEIFVY